jgi:nicotinate-nucleotide adenylyltransferase
MVIFETKASAGYVVLGGTFDPIHNGHLISAQALLQDMGYQTVYLMPCGDAYHKDTRLVSSTDHRLTMVKLAMESFPQLSLDTREIKRQGATYTVDTLQELRQELGESAHLCWVMGTDAAASVTSWHNWQRLFELANVIVMARAGEPDPILDWPALHMEDAQEFKQQAHGCYMMCTLPQVLLSSSDIRHAVSKGQSVVDHVPQKVNDYIQKHGLYRGNN